MIEREEITGLVLAGGLGQRMQGKDKGLQMFRGVPLAQHALQRLRPQVASVAVNANRNLARYASWGAPVWPDTIAHHPGPLAGLLAGLMRCPTPWLLTVPCDTPWFPHDLAERLARAADDAHANIALASTRDEHGATQTQPVFCLVHRRLARALAQFLSRGSARVRDWAREQGCAIAYFDEGAGAPSAFQNANSLAELQALEGT